MKNKFWHSKRKKIKSAIVTDFILSVEIVIIALGTVMRQTHFITNNGRNYHCNHSYSGRLAS
jgi:predicted DNA repair protein MutK